MIQANDVNIGDFVTHYKVGRIEVIGIAEHCGDFAVSYKGGWVYLHNCSKLEKK